MASRPRLCLRRVYVGSTSGLRWPHVREARGEFGTGPWGDGTSRLRAPTTSSTRYTKAFSINQTRTVKCFSVDAAGNAEAVQSQLIRIDGTAPTTTISCNGVSCSGSTYSSAVTVTLTATDGSGGSGVSSTHYTTNGTTPTLISPTYAGPFTLSATTTVQYRSWDV